MDRLIEFADHLRSTGKSDNTVKGYLRDIILYIKWFDESYAFECTALYRQNVLEYVSYLKNVMVHAKTINHKLSSLPSYNEYLVAVGIQANMVVRNTDMIKVQTEFASLTKVTELDVKHFVQRVLESKSKRNYALVTLFVYNVMCISEALSIRFTGF